MQMNTKSESRIKRIKARVKYLYNLIEEMESEIEQEKKANESHSQEPVGEAEQTEDDTRQETGELRQVHRSEVKRKLAKLRRKKKRY